MTKVVIVPIRQGEPEYKQDFHYAVEVRDTVRGLVHRWTFRTWEKAYIERKRVADWYEIPPGNFGTGPIATALLVCLFIPWQILSMAVGQ